MAKDLTVTLVSGTNRAAASIVILYWYNEQELEHNIENKKTKEFTHLQGEKTTHQKFMRLGLNLRCN